MTATNLRCATGTELPSRRRVSAARPIRQAGRGRRAGRSDGVEPDAEPTRGTTSIPDQRTVARSTGSARLMRFDGVAPGRSRAASPRRGPREDEDRRTSTQARPARTRRGGRSRDGDAPSDPSCSRPCPRKLIDRPAGRDVRPRAAATASIESARRRARQASRRSTSPRSRPRTPRTRDVVSVTEVRQDSRRRAGSARADPLPRARASRGCSRHRDTPRSPRCSRPAYRRSACTCRGARR